MTRAPEREAGFTLLELLAAIAVLGLIIVMLSNGFLFGLDATRLAAAGQNNDRLAVDAALRHLIEAADPGTFPDPATLRGSAETLLLTTELPNGGRGAPQRADVVLSAAGGKLVLRWRPHRHAEWFGPGPAWTETVLADGVEHVGFAYRGAAADAPWSASWSAGRLPSLVRLTIEPGAGSREHWPPLVVPTLREPIEQ